MWTIVVLYVITGSAPQVMEAQTQFPSEEACTERLAQDLTLLRTKFEATQRPYILTGKCFEGEGQPT